MKLNYRIGLFALAIIFGVAFSLPSLTQSEAGKKVTLGLDLQGGLHMLLGVKTEEATKSRIKSIAASIKHFAERNDILIDALTFDESSVSFEVLDSDEIKAFDEYFKEVEGI
ncbi:MAG: protein translocase subunit SecD, partial [Campylobacterota bacterium]|nr:protein translocase subunit SecD [Campylobacterota bacterium]